MRWLVFVVVLAACLLGAGLGVLLARRGRRPATIGVAVCLAVFFVRVAFRFLPTVEYGLLPYDAYAVIRPWWAMPFAFVIVATGPFHMSTPLAKRGVGVFAVLLGVVALRTLWSTASFDPATVNGTVGRDGVCYQSTGYTCGAASAAMLLHQVGIASDERDMAVRCWTNGLTGTDELCVCRGLRQRLEGTGKVPRFAHGGWDDLRRLARPAMVTKRWSVAVDHWVVVLEATDAGVRVLDPLDGPLTVSRDEFVRDWRGDMIWIE